MKNYGIALVVMVSMLLVCSTASAARPYVVVPGPVVYGYWPTAPAYAYAVRPTPIPRRPTPMRVPSFR